MKLRGMRISKISWWNLEEVACPQMLKCCFVTADAALKRLRDVIRAWRDRTPGWSRWWRYWKYEKDTAGSICSRRSRWQTDNDSRTRYCVAPSRPVRIGLALYWDDSNVQCCSLLIVQGYLFDGQITGRRPIWLLILITASWNLMISWGSNWCK